MRVRSITSGDYEIWKLEGALEPRSSNIDLPAERITRIDELLKYYYVLPGCATQTRYSMLTGDDGIPVLSFVREFNHANLEFFLPRGSDVGNLTEHVCSESRVQQLDGLILRAGQ